VDDEQIAALIPAAYDAHMGEGSGRCSSEIVID